MSPITFHFAFKPSINTFKYFDNVIFCFNHVFYFEGCNTAFYFKPDITCMLLHDFYIAVKAVKSLLIQTLVLQNCGRKALVITFVCTWLHCDKRQIILIIISVSHCSEGFQNSGLKVQDRELQFHSTRLHQLYLSMRYCSRATDFLLDHVM